MSKLKSLKRKFGKVSGAKLLTIGFVSAFAAVGVYMLIATHAAGSSVAIEPESGNTSNQISTGSDTNASKGQYAQFGSGKCPAGQTGTPPNCQPTGGGSGASAGGNHSRAVGMRVGLRAINQITYFGQWLMLFL